MEQHYLSGRFSELLSRGTYTRLDADIQRNDDQATPTILLPPQTLPDVLQPASAAGKQKRIFCLYFSAGWQVNTLDANIHLSVPLCVHSNDIGAAHAVVSLRA